MKKELWRKSIFKRLIISFILILLPIYALSIIMNERFMHENCPETFCTAPLMDKPKNTFAVNGHNSQADREDLPLYLPGNGGLLLAVAMMAAGWDNDG